MVGSSMAGTGQLRYVWHGGIGEARLDKEGLGGLGAARLGAVELICYGGYGSARCGLVSRVSAVESWRVTD